MRRVGAVLCAAAVAAACSSGTATKTATGSSRSTTVAAVTTTTPAVPTAPGLWSDEPCTRAAPPGTSPQPVPLRLDDLERMVLSRDDVGGLRGFESDVARHGYWGNGEFRSMEVNPPSTCDDLQRFGRIIGFADAYVRDTQPAHAVTFSAHLFWSEADARGWVAAFTDGLRTSVGTPVGPTSFDPHPLAALGDGAVAADHVGPDGVRTWVMFVRGPIVGWVTDLHAGAADIDVAAAAAKMATRIEQVAAIASARRTRPTLDVAGLVSAPLPLAEFGDRYRALAWDFFFGGCADTAERASIVGEEVADRIAGFGRITGCTNMYDPPQGVQSEIVRVYSRVDVYEDAAGASAQLADATARSVADGARRFDTGAIGDEAVGTVATANEGGEFVVTSVSFRIGDLLGVVSIQDRNRRDATAEAAELAVELAGRVRSLSPG